MLPENGRVLIMDDDEVVRRSYERVLKGAGYEVRSAGSGRDALAEARDHDYDVMLADLKMPGMDGLTAIRHAREYRPDMRIIIITGYPDEASGEEAERLGVQDYLTKPLAPDALARATEEALHSPVRPFARERRQPAPRPALEPAPAPEPVVEASTAGLVVEQTEVAVPPAASESTEPEARPGLMKDLATLAVAPVVGLAYVMFLPFAGFAIMIGYGALGLVKAVRPNAGA